MQEHLPIIITGFAAGGVGWVVTQIVRWRRRAKSTDAQATGEIPLGEVCHGTLTHVGTDHPVRFHDFKFGTEYEELKPNSVANGGLPLGKTTFLVGDGVADHVAKSWDAVKPGMDQRLLISHVGDKPVAEILKHSRVHKCRPMSEVAGEVPTTRFKGIDDALKSGELVKGQEVAFLGGSTPVRNTKLSSAVSYLKSLGFTVEVVNDQNYYAIDRQGKRCRIGVRDGTSLEGPAIYFFPGSRQPSEETVVVEDNLTVAFRNQLGKNHRIGGPAVITGTREEWWYMGKELPPEHAVHRSGDRIEFLDDRGALHRLDGAAVIYDDGRCSWYYHGKQVTNGLAADTVPHDENWPVAQTADDLFVAKSVTREKSGKIVSVNDQPSIVCLSGTKLWTDGPTLHRVIGPAREWWNGRKEWWVHGKLHNLDGPAVTYQNGLEEYYVNGERMWSKSVWEEKRLKIRPWERPAGQTAAPSDEVNGGKRPVYDPTSGVTRWAPSDLSQSFNVDDEGTKFWFKRREDGTYVYHRVNIPAVLYKDGRKEWWYKGRKLKPGLEVHLDNQSVPFISDGNSIHHYYVESDQHYVATAEHRHQISSKHAKPVWNELTKKLTWAEDAPTRIGPNGTLYWEKKLPDGREVLHRMGGPAKVYLNGEGEYWYEGRKLKLGNSTGISDEGKPYIYASGRLCHDFVMRDPSLFEPEEPVPNNDKPSYITASGSKVWYKRGAGQVRHRVGGPAVIWATGDEEWWYEGRKLKPGYQIHKNKDGSTFVTVEGRTYSDVEWPGYYEPSADENADNPSRIYGDGEKWWFKPGTNMLHRVGAPAVVKKDGTEEWYYEGRKLRDGHHVHRNLHGTVYISQGPHVFFDLDNPLYYALANTPKPDDRPPSFVDSHGNQFWWQHREKGHVLHRVGGPAFVTRSGDTKEWWYKGRKLYRDYEVHRHDDVVYVTGPGGRYLIAKADEFVATLFVAVPDKPVPINPKDAPDAVSDDGGKCWYMKDKWAVPGRAGGPAVINADGTEEWWWDGRKLPEGHKIKRTSMGSDVYVTFYDEHDRLHRDDGPATFHELEPNKFTRQWYCHGERHRADGPAVVKPNSCDWYFHGVKLAKGCRVYRNNGVTVFVGADRQEYTYLHNGMIDSAGSSDTGLRRWGDMLGRVPEGEFTKNGRNQYHSIDGKPAFVNSSGTKFWYKDGQAHRDDGPATEYPDGTHAYWYEGKQLGPFETVSRSGLRVNFKKKGKIHRDGAPAVIDDDGSYMWYRHGQLHRHGGEAAVYDARAGRKEWWQDGRRHRKDGPAVTSPNGNEYWYAGKQLPLDQWIARDGKNAICWFKKDGDKIVPMLHRIGGPAVVHEDGIEEWWVEGKRHRNQNQPAYTAIGHREWWVEGKRSRNNGPAVVKGDHEEWWVAGTRMNRELVEQMFPENFVRKAIGKKKPETVKKLEHAFVHGFPETDSVTVTPQNVVFDTEGLQSSHKILNIMSASTNTVSLTDKPEENKEGPAKWTVSWEDVKAKVNQSVKEHLRKLDKPGEANRYLRDNYLPPKASGEQTEAAAMSDADALRQVEEALAESWKEPVVLKSTPGSEDPGDGEPDKSKNLPFFKLEKNKNYKLTVLPPVKLNGEKMLFHKVPAPCVCPMCEYEKESKRIQAAADQARAEGKCVITAVQKSNNKVVQLEVSAKMAKTITDYLGHRYPRDKGKSPEVFTEVKRSEAVQSRDLTQAVLKSSRLMSADEIKYVMDRAGQKVSDAPDPALDPKINKRFVGLFSPDDLMRDLLVKRALLDGRMRMTGQPDGKILVERREDEEPMSWLESTAFFSLLAVSCCASLAVFGWSIYGMKLLLDWMVS